MRTDERRYHADTTECAESACDALHLPAYAILDRLRGRTAVLVEKLEEMTRLRDNAVRALNREDTEIPIDLEELVAQGLDAVIGDWEGDVPQERVISSIASHVHTDVAKVVEDRDAIKKRLDAVCNEVFTITDSGPTLREDAPEHLYHLGLREGLSQACFAVLRGLGVFEPNHVPYAVVEREVLHDLMCIAAYVSRGRSAVDAGVYPDALARRTLGSFSDEELEAAADQGEGQQ